MHEILGMKYEAWAEVDIASIPSPEAEACNALRAMKQFWNKGAFHRFLEFYAESSRTGSETDNPGVLRQRALVEHCRSGSDEKPEAGFLDFDNVHAVRLLGGEVLLSSLWSLKMQETLQAGRVVFLLAKSGDCWRVLHEYSVMT